MTTPQCRYTVRHETAGYATAEAFASALERSPELSPCPRYRGTRGTCNWVLRTTCAKCPNRLLDGQSPREERHV